MNDKKEVYCIKCKWHDGEPNVIGCNAPESYTGKVIKDYINGDYKERNWYSTCDIKYPNKRESNGCKYYKKK